LNKEKSQGSKTIAHDSTLQTQQPHSQANQQSKRHCRAIRFHRLSKPPEKYAYHVNFPITFAPAVFVPVNATSSYNNTYASES
jgi:hypothetical protein